LAAKLKKITRESYILGTMHRTFKYKTIEETQFKFFETVILAFCMYVCGTVFTNRLDEKMTVIVNYIFESKG
jgi:ABC-type amino acid transport system permease subunit